MPQYVHVSPTDNHPLPPLKAPLICLSEPPRQPAGLVIASLQVLSRRQEVIRSYLIHLRRWNEAEHSEGTRLRVLPFNIRHGASPAGPEQRPRPRARWFFEQHHIRRCDMAVDSGSNLRAAVGCVAPDKSAEPSISLALWPVRACSCFQSAIESEPHRRGSILFPSVRLIEIPHLHLTSNKGTQCIVLFSRPGLYRVLLSFKRNALDVVPVCIG